MTNIPFNPESSEAESSKPMVVQDDLPKIKPNSASGAMRRILSAFTRTGLSSQLLLTVLPLALAPIAVASAIGYFVTQSRSEYELTEQIKGQSVLAGETISDNVRDQADIAAVIAKSPFLLGRVRNNIEVAQSQELSGLSIDELEKRFDKNKLIAPNQELNDFLREVAATKRVAEIIVADRNGLNVGFSNQPTDFVQSDEDWWKQGEAQAQWIGDPVFDASAGQYGIDITRRVVDPRNGNFIGVIRLFSSAAVFGDLSNMLTSTGLRGSQQLQVIDLDTQLNVINFRSEKEQVVRAAQELPPQIVTDLGLRLLAALPEIKDRSISEIEREIQGSLSVEDLIISGSQTKNQSGEPLALIATFYYEGKQYALSTVPELNWISVASMNQAEIEVTGRELLNLFTIIALALGAVGTVLTIALSRRLASPLNDLSEKARQVSDGDLNVAAELKGSAEARTLALTFNNLVFRVKDALQEQTLSTRRAKLAADITGRRLLSSQELPFLLSDALTEARDILKSDRMVVYEFKPDWSGTIAAESVANGLPSAFQEQLEDPCIPAVTRDKYLMDGILLENNIAAANLHPEHLALLQSLKVKSILGVPILSQGKLFGLLITHHCHTPYKWQPSEVEFLKQLGLQLGLVIERIQLFEQTQALVEEQRQIKEGLQRNALQLLMDIDPVMQGDLTARARVTEDEIGTVADSYNATIASLRKIVSQVQQATQQVAETANTSESAVKNLSDSAGQQAAEILSVLERVEEMATSVRLVAVSAEKAEVAVQEAAQTVQEGDEAMNRTVDGILAIRETVAETAKKVKRLGESSQKISNVVNLISSFAAQTNMLALNASIEASRAGEDGKGFAVVAEEVRNLARQSAEATTEIEKLVANIQSETNELVRTMEAGTEQVVAGTRLVDDTRQSLNKITATSLQISELVEAIAQATITQSQASETVTETMTTVAKIADKNSTTASEVNASFEQLRSVAQSLQSEVGRFKLN